MRRLQSDKGLKSEKGCGSVLARGCSKCNPKNTRTVGPPAQVCGSLISPPHPPHPSTALILGTVQTTIQGFLRILRGWRGVGRWSRGQGEGREAGRLSSATSGENTLVSTRTHAKWCSCSAVISYFYVIWSSDQSRMQCLRSSLSFYTCARFILYAVLLLIFCILFFVYFTWLFFLYFTCML